MSIFQASFSDNKVNTSELRTEKNKKANLWLLILVLFLLFWAIGLSIFYFWQTENKTPEIATQETVKSPESDPEGIMILIEYRDTIGLVNFVNELQKRNIPGLLHVSGEFVEANCETIKELLNHDMEIMASLSGEPLWGSSYEKQKEQIIETTEKIKTCTGQPVKIISSPYMASDINTLKAADELGIPYITARGTTDTKATVYEIEGYETKILSVSNIPKVQFKYGSLCDYSYYERAGTPEDMMAELTRAIQPLTDKEKERYGPNHKITPVTHTNIGGYLKPWTQMWLEFFDQTANQIDWVDLDTFMADSDWILPDWQLPINKNAPYTPEKIRPLVSYEEVEKVQNPCRVEDLGGIEAEISPIEVEEEITEGRLMMFHNGKGPMCLEAIDFLSTVDYPVEEFLDTQAGFRDQLEKLKTEFGQSEGVSESFGYYPMIFVNDRAFSGFNEEIKAEIVEEMEKR
ncbi:MAG: polysaccharide deacetylase family protein [Patescibacteria group bacterium]|jgi:flagellar basal body-associated protein FliL